MAEFRYAVGDAVLVYYNSLIYEAKCLKRIINTDGYPIYYIHYKGWKSTYDEWVYEEILLDVNIINLQRMMSLRKKNLRSNNKASKHSMAANKVKVCNKRKNNYKRSNKASKKSSKSNVSSSQQLTSKTKKQIDSQPKFVISKMDETSKKVLVTEITPSSLDISSKPIIKKENNDFFGNNLNIKLENQETNKILTLNTTSSTRSNVLEVPRKRSTRNQQPFSSDQLSGVTSKQQEIDHGLNSTIHKNIEVIDLTMAETENENSTTISNESTKIVSDFLTTILTNPASCGLTLNIYLNGQQ